MCVKLFLLGRPGCGKSRTARYITEFVAPFYWTTRRFKDYDILAKMAQTDRRFRLLNKGFDVLEDSALDEALQKLDREVNEHCQKIEDNQSSNHELVIIEFARSNYNDAFEQLSQDIQQNAYFLFINADFKLCKQRIQDRISPPTSPDDHFVSDNAMDTHYHNQFPPQNLIITSRLTTLTNNGSWLDFTQKLEPFIRQILTIPDSDN